MMPPLGLQISGEGCVNTMEYPPQNPAQWSPVNLSMHHVALLAFEIVHLRVDINSPGLTFPALTSPQDISFVRFLVVAI